MLFTRLTALSLRENRRHGKNGNSRETSGSTCHRGQRVGVAGQKPAAVWLLAVDGEPITGQLCGFTASARYHRQRVPAAGVSDFADDYHLFQLAHATDSGVLVSSREADRECIPADWRAARIQKHDIIRHQFEQSGKIASVDGVYPSGVHLTNSSFIRFHLQPPLPQQFTRLSGIGVHSTPPVAGPVV